MRETIPALAEVFGASSDWRASHGKLYEIGTVLTVAFLAILSGENNLPTLNSHLLE